jgi:ethanolamine permease
VTILAIVELLVFMGVVSPGFSISNFVAHGWSGADSFSTASIPGIVAAIPFAIWFFLAIEGVAMAAEEAKDPRKTIPRAYIAGILTLVVLAIGVMVFAGGAGDWKALSNVNDPLPQAMKMIVGENSGWLHMLVWIGLFGLVASFHGIILGYSRQIYALSRAGYMPKFFGAVHPKFSFLVRSSPEPLSVWRHLGDNPGCRSVSYSQPDHDVGVRCDCHVHRLDDEFVCTAQKSPTQRPLLPLPTGVPRDRPGVGGDCLVTMIYYNQLLTLIFFGLMAAAFLTTA